MSDKSCNAVLLFLLLGGGSVFSQDAAQDTAQDAAQSAITEFDKQFTLDVFTNFNIGLFRLQEISRYKTDMPWAIGAGVRYQKISARITIPVPLNNNSFNFEMNSYFEKMFLEIFLRNYRYFYHEDDIEYNDAGLSISAAGITAGWIQNNKQHSLASVFNLGEKQNVSNGSVLLGAGLFYTSLYSQNKDMRRYHEKQRLFYFGPSAGYSYTWVLPHNIFINTGINVGLNFGINITENTVLFVPQIRPKISFGRHDDTWSINMIAHNNVTILLWEPDVSDMFMPETITLNLSKRF
jgi:hypothetical protein